MRGGERNRKQLLGRISIRTAGIQVSLMLYYYFLVICGDVGFFVCFVGLVCFFFLGEHGIFFFFTLHK